MILGSGTLAAFLSTSKGYMMNTATAAVVDGKMEPMQAAPITQQLVITGQVLYETFVGDSAENVSKMDLIRGLVGKADALQIKGACDKLVEIAKGKDAAKGVPDKVVKDGKEVANRGPKTQSAMNTRTVIQQAWGALSYAREALDALGYRETTGYQDMRVIAKKALESAGLKWSGDKLPTDADKAKAAALKKSKVEMDALLTVQKENPFGMVVGESLQDWNARTFSIAQETMQEAVDEKLTKQTTDTFNSLIKTLDENQLFVLTKMLIEHSPFDLAVLAGSEEGVEEEATA